MRPLIIPVTIWLGVLQVPVGTTTASPRSSRPPALSPDSLSSCTGSASVALRMKWTNPRAGRRASLVLPPWSDPAPGWLHSRVYMTPPSGSMGVMNGAMTGLPESPTLDAIRARIAERFGLVPSFFMMARADPAIVEAMFGLVEFAYFDSPIPVLFKERLFTYVSRFCSVPYCMARHCAFLVGCGNVAGDPAATGITVDEAIALLATPFPDARRRDHLLADLRSVGDELDAWPEAGSYLENAIFFAAAVVFVMPQENKPLLVELERLLGDRRHQYLLLFLGFIRFAHFWTETHPQLRVEDDIENLLAEQRALAEWVRQYSPQVEREVSDARAELRDVELLRARTEQSGHAVVELRDLAATRTRAAQEAENRVTATPDSGA